MEVAAVAAPSVEGDVVLSARNVAKNFGNVHALKGVNFDVRRGEVTTLFGENGAGKSTLMNILAGIYPPSSGRILLHGEEVEFSSAMEACEQGISIIHQELSLAPNLSVRDNIFLGREIRTPTGVDFAEEDRQSRVLLQALEEDIDPRVPVEALRLGQQQIVEIARALSVNSRILIMDEPTSALSASEVAVLFRVIHDLKSHGVSIVYISHHLEEALQITDYAVVLRDGVMTAYAPRQDIDLEWIVRHMVGDNFDLGKPPRGYEFGDAVIKVDNLSVADTIGNGQKVVDGMSVNVRAGEIVCIYGLMGAGRTELLECMAGRLPALEGTVELNGEEITNLSIGNRIAAGLVLVPEDRQRDGLIQTMSIGQNLSLANLLHLMWGPFTSNHRESRHVSNAIRRMTVKTASADNLPSSLSGGNQQKVVLGKMWSTNPKAILLDEPTRGIDVGAKAEVFRLLAEGAREGLAVLYTTSEVGECLSVAHQIIVMRKGQISAEFGSGATKSQIMAASGEAAAQRKQAEQDNVDV